MPTTFPPHHPYPLLMVLRLPKQSRRPMHRQPPHFRGLHCSVLRNPGSPTALLPEESFVGFPTLIPPVWCTSITLIAPLVYSCSASCAHWLVIQLSKCD